MKKFFLIFVVISITAFSCTKDEKVESPVVGVQKELTIEEKCKNEAINYIRNSLSKHGLQDNSHFRIEKIELNDMDSEYLIRCEFTAEKFKGGLQDAILTVPVNKTTIKVDTKTGRVKFFV